MIVTLHGFLGAPSLWQTTFAQPALASLAVTHRWLPGHGPEPWLPADAAHASFDAIVDAVAATLPAGATLVGYSLGARLALGLVARHPRAIAGAVLIGPHPGLSDAAERAERQRWDEGQAAEIEHDGLASFAERWAALPLFATQASAPERERARQQAARRDHRPDAVAWAMRALGLGRMPDYGRQLAQATTLPPVTLITGALDEKFTRLAASAVTRWRGARHAVVAGAGHNVPLEAPEALAEALRATRTLLHDTPARERGRDDDLTARGDGSSASKP